MDKMGIHRWQHEQNLLHKCNSCNHTFGSPRNLDRHHDNSKKCQAKERKREVEGKQAGVQLPVKAGQKAPHADEGDSSDEQGDTVRIQAILMSDNSAIDSDSDDIEVIDHFTDIQHSRPDAPPPVPFANRAIRVGNATLDDPPIGDGVVLDPALAALDVFERNIEVQSLVNSDKDSQLSPGALPGNPEGALGLVTEVNQYEDGPLDLSQGSKKQSSGSANMQPSNASTAKLGCNFCGKQFTRKESLDRHMPTHSPDRPFSCSRCDSKFKVSGYLKKHFKKWHGNGTGVKQLSGKLGGEDIDNQENSDTTDSEGTEENDKMNTAPEVQRRGNVGEYRVGGDGGDEGDIDSSSDNGSDDLTGDESTEEENETNHNTQRQEQGNKGHEDGEVNKGVHSGGRNIVGGEVEVDDIDKNVEHTRKQREGHGPVPGGVDTSWWVSVNDQAVSRGEEGYHADLAASLEQNKLPFVVRDDTRKDGNCLYDVLAKEVERNNIPDKPRDYRGMREGVCDAILQHPQVNDWIDQHFEGDKDKFKKFIDFHRKDGTYTDERGLMCMGAAFYLERNIHIVGTANIDTPPGFIVLGEPNPAPPLYIGYYQNKHYVSLRAKECEELDSSETTVEVTGIHNNDDREAQVETLREQINVPEVLTSSNAPEVEQRSSGIESSAELLLVETRNVELQNRTMKQEARIGNGVALLQGSGEVCPTSLPGQELVAGHVTEGGRNELGEDIAGGGGEGVEVGSAVLKRQKKGKQTWVRSATSRGQSKEEVVLRGYLSGEAEKKAKEGDVFDMLMSGLIRSVKDAAAGRGNANVDKKMEGLEKLLALKDEKAILECLVEEFLVAEIAAVNVKPEIINID